MAGHDTTAHDILALDNFGRAALPRPQLDGNAAIAWHQGPSQELRALTEEPWAERIWRSDRRFSALLPSTDATVAEIARDGHDDHQRVVYRNLPKLRRRMDRIAAMCPEQAIRDYVAAGTGQRRKRLTVLLAVTGIARDEPITKAEGARRLGVSDQRMAQIVAQFWQACDRTTPPAGIWPPHLQRELADGQRLWLPTAERGRRGWSDPRSSSMVGQGWWATRSWSVPTVSARTPKRAAEQLSRRRASPAPLGSLTIAPPPPMGQLACHIKPRLLRRLAQHCDRITTGSHCQSQRFGDRRTPSRTRASTPRCFQMDVGPRSGSVRTASTRTRKPANISSLRRRALLARLGS